jgi:hypothetical protein
VCDCFYNKVPVNLFFLRKLWRDFSDLKSRWRQSNCSTRQPTTGRKSRSALQRRSFGHRPTATTTGIRASPLPTGRACCELFGRTDLDVQWLAACLEWCDTKWRDTKAKKVHLDNIIKIVNGHVDSGVSKVDNLRQFVLEYGLLWAVAEGDLLYSRKVLLANYNIFERDYSIAF